MKTIYQQALSQTRAMTARIEAQAEARARAAGATIVQRADVHAVLDTLS